MFCFQLQNLVKYDVDEKSARLAFQVYINLTEGTILFSINLSNRHMHNFLFLPQISNIYLTF